MTLLSKLSAFLQPRTLLGRTFGLLTLCVVAYTIAGLVFTYSYYFDREVRSAKETLNLLADTAKAPLAQYARSGDYEGVQSTLRRMTQASQTVRLVRFSDGKGVILSAGTEQPSASQVPSSLKRQVETRIAPLIREVPIREGQSGTLELHVRAEGITEDIWAITRAYLLFAVGILVPVLYLARHQLKLMVADLATAANFAAKLEEHRGQELRLASRTAETDLLERSLNEVSRRLSTQHFQLADSEARKTAILSAGLDCFITLDEQGCVVDFNLAAEEAFGYRVDEVRGRLMSELIIPPELRAAHEKGMAHWRATGEGPVLRQRIEITAMRRSGEIFPVELTVVPFSSGEANYFAGFVRDITGRRKLEEERARVTVLLENSLRELGYQKSALDEHAIVSISDANGKIIYVNDKYTEISGYSRDELVGSTHRIVKSGVQPDSFYQDLWTTITAGKTWHSEIANRNKAGELYWVAATIVPWTDDAGKPYQYVSIYTDITAQKLSENALEEARRREIRTAYDIQRTLLFGGSDDKVHGTEIATYTEPSQGIDGDFFAITRLHADSFEVLAGDVMGKGVPAALVGAAVKSSYHMALTELLANNPDPGGIPSPRAIVDALHRKLTARLVELESFVTLALYRIDRRENSLTYVNAGHTAGLLARRDGSLQLVEGTNLPIGVLPDEIYHEHRIDLSAGEALLVFSDGILDAHNAGREFFGMERLRSLVQSGLAADLPPTSMVQALRQQVRDFVGSDLLSDDQSAIMISLQPLRSGKRRSLEQRADPSLLVLPWRIDALPPLRQRIMEFSAQLSQEGAEALTLGCFEAATNILRHAKPYFADATIACRLTLTADAVSVELIYPGPSFEPPADPEPDFSGNTEGGFGLYIIENTVDEAEYRSVVPGISLVRLVKRRSAEAGLGQ